MISHPQNMYSSNKNDIKKLTLTNSRNIRQLAEQNYDSSSSDSFHCQRDAKQVDEITRDIVANNLGTPKVKCDVDEFEDLNNSNGSVVMKEEIKTNQQTSQKVNSKYGEASERSVGQIPLQQPRKHHRNIALKTGRKGEQKESEDQDQPMKTVYLDSSRYEGIHNSGPNDPLSTLKAKMKDDVKIKEALGTFSVEILEETLQTLNEKMEEDIEKVKRKYQKYMDPIKKAIYFKLNDS